MWNKRLGSIPLFPNLLEYLWMFLTHVFITSLPPIRSRIWVPATSHSATNFFCIFLWRCPILKTIPFQPIRITFIWPTTWCYVYWMEIRKSYQIYYWNTYTSKTLFINRNAFATWSCYFSDGETMSSSFILYAKCPVANRSPLVFANAPIIILNSIACSFVTFCLPIKLVPSWGPSAVALSTLAQWSSGTSYVT